MASTKSLKLAITGTKMKVKCFFYFTQGVSMAEVEVNTLTGDWKCLGAEVKMDIGRSINPSIDYGQIEVAFIQGMGLFTIKESLRFNSGPLKDLLATRGSSAYKTPGLRDISQEFNFSMLKIFEWENLGTIRRSKGMGEPPLFLGSVVLFAIRDALKVTRQQYGVKAEIGKDNKDDGLLRLDSPATPERIRMNFEDPIVKKCWFEPLEGDHNFYMRI